MRYFTLLLLLTCLTSLPASAQSYRKAVETKDNVKKKLFPKRKRIELNLDFGTIINQSYVDSFLFHGGINYFFSETWGIGIEGALMFNSDRTERTCIENFFNRPPGLDLGGSECLEVDGDIESAKQIVQDAGTNGDGIGATMGPAYVPIRVTDLLIGLNLIWNPIYGKQLTFMSMTGYFDLFFNFGGGLSFNKFFPLKDKEDNGNPYRGNPTDTVKPGIDVNDANAQERFGIAGRPIPQDESSIYLTFGIGQKYHFLKRFHIKVELRNYTLLFVEETGFDNFFTLWGGAGVRF